MNEHLRTSNEFHQERKSEKMGIPFICSIGMGPHSINLYSPIDDFTPFLKEKGKGYIPWMPGWVVKDYPSPTNYSIVYTPGMITKFEYHDKDNTLLITGDPNEFRDGQPIAYLTFWLTEAQRQKEGIVTSHAAAMSINNNGVLILGERGDGKTSVCLDLGRKYGYKLIANDLAMIGYNKLSDSVKIHDGTKIFGLRLSAVRGRFPELMDLFQIQDERSWVNKTFVYPQTIGIETDQEVRTVTRAFMVHVDSTGIDQLSIFKMDDLWIRNYLYENFSRYLRGVAIVPFGVKSHNFLDYLPSLDNEECHSNRINLINHLIKNIEIWNVSGGKLEEIVDFIHMTSTSVKSSKSSN